MNTKNTKSIFKSNMTRLLALIFLFSITLQTWAETLTPSVTLSSYYSAADGKKSDALRQALKGIISSHTTVSYGNLGSLMQYSDTEDADGKNVVDIYTNCTFTVSGALTWASSGSVGAGMNREHTVPQSWFDEASPMVSDAFHIYPTDCKANNNRSSYLYGEFSGNGTLLDGTLSLSINGGDTAYFTLSGSFISSSDALSGTKITITYAPKAVGNHSTTLRITGCGVESHEVTLTGICEARPTVTWIVDGASYHANAVVSGARPTVPAAPSDCSGDANRVFVGWTSENNYNDATNEP